jgi:hypothetical protein
MVHELKAKLTSRKKKQKQQQQDVIGQQKMWITFTYFSPLVGRVNSLSKQAKLKIAFRAVKTIEQQLTGKQTNSDPSGIHELKCNTCNRAYVGQSGRTINVSFKEHVKYIRSNNSTSAFAAHVLGNRNEYRMKENTIQLLKPCQKKHAWIAGRRSIYKYSVNSKY